jgi:undecaprenyl-diphosphatase
MSSLQALIIAVLQGVTELFPISSLAHAVIVPALLRWQIDQHSLSFLPFLVTLHLGTAVAMLVYFWRDWLALAQGLVGATSPAVAKESRHIILLIVMATIPAVILGGLFEGFLRRLFGTPAIAAIFLILNGLLLLLGEALRRRSARGTRRPISTLSLGDALVVGLAQCLAFFPGISRSGATIVAGLFRGVDHEGSARFSFLIGTPIIFAATAQQAYRLHKSGVTIGSWSPVLLAAVVAGVTAFASTAFLMRYFRSHDRWAMTPFAIYCFLFGIVSLATL